MSSDPVLRTASPTRRQPLWRELVRPLADPNGWDRALRRISPHWSTTTVRARVIDRVEETADTLSLWLKPNRRWRGHRPGQHVMLGVEIDGVRRQRAFSVSNAAKRGDPMRITLQRQRPGGVTDWLHRNVNAGEVVELGGPGGEFVLPPLATSDEAAPLLMIAGGTGITPLMAMLHQLADEGSKQGIVLVQLFRSAETRLFADELGRLERRLPGLAIRTHASAELGRLDPASLADQVPELDRRTTLLCGPEALMTEIDAEWTRRGLGERLITERFGAPKRSGASGGRAEIRAIDADRVFTQDANQTLLEAAEAAGLEPPSGCRAGLCRTCLCHKPSGRVRNLVTGRVSDEPGEWIQLCISAAESDLELSLQGPRSPSAR